MPKTLEYDFDPATEAHKIRNYLQCPDTQSLKDQKEPADPKDKSKMTDKTN